MRQFLDRFILDIPVLFIKQFPYAWILVIALWSWPPVTALVFALIVVIGLLALQWRSAAWISNLRREHGSPDGTFHIDRPAVPFAAAAPKIALLLAGSTLLAWLLNGQFGLNFWQYFFLIAGFTLLYQDTRFFGAPTTYVITDQGIGIHFISGHIDYRLFFRFDEISRIKKSEYQPDSTWSLFARRRDTKDGLLMIPTNPGGFTKRIEKLFIAPKDVDTFLEQLPRRYGNAL